MPLEEIPKHAKYIDLIQANMRQFVLKMSSFDQVINQMSSKVTYDQEVTRTEFRVLRNDIDLISELVNKHDF